MPIEELVHHHSSYGDRRIRRSLLGDSHVSGGRLPYPIAGVEDTATCTILADLEDDQVGMDTPRAFIDCISSEPDTDHSASNDGLEDRLAIRDRTNRFPEGHVIIVMGACHIFHDKPNKMWGMDGEIGMIWTGTVDRVTDLWDTMVADEENRGKHRVCALRNAVSTMEQVLGVAGLIKFQGWPTPRYVEPTDHISPSHKRPVATIKIDGKTSADSSFIEL